MPINSKKKGSAYECEITRELQSRGFPDALTSRYASRKRDDEKVDIVNTDPWNAQCKATKKAPNFHDELDKMPQDGNYNVIFHRRPYKGDIVVMRKETFYEINGMLKTEEII